MTTHVQPHPTVPPPRSPPPGVTGPPPARRKVLRVELAVMAFLAAVPSFVISLRGFNDPTDIDVEMSVLELVAGLLAALGPAAVATYLLWRDGRLDIAGFGRRRLGFIAGYGALGWVCCLIGVITLGLVINAVLLATGHEIDSSDDLAFDLSIGTLLAALALSVTAGIGEEIVFRAYAISRMEEAGFARSAIWAPLAVFASVHLYQGPLAVVVVAIVGGVLVWLFRWTRSVWPLMVTHFLYNITVFLLAASAG